MNPLEISDKSYHRLASRMQDLVPDFLVPQRNYGQWKSRFSGSFHLNPILSKEIRDFYRTKLPPERKMGVGYRDKGSKRDLARDGSPDWTEISEDQLFQERNLEYEVEKCQNFNDLAHLFYRRNLISAETLKCISVDKSLSKGNSETLEGRARTE